MIGLCAGRPYINKMIEPDDENNIFWLDFPAIVDKYSKHIGSIPFKNGEKNFYSQIYGPYILDNDPALSSSVS